MHHLDHAVIPRLGAGPDGERKGAIMRAAITTLMLVALFLLPISRGYISYRLGLENGPVAIGGWGWNR